MSEARNVVMNEAQFRAESQRYMRDDFPKREKRIVECRVQCSCAAKPYPHLHGEAELQRFYSFCKFK